MTQEKVMKKEDNFSSQLLSCFDNDASEVEAVTDTKKLRKVNYHIHCRPEQPATGQVPGRSGPLFA